MSSWWSGHKIIDPVELEARFSTDSGLDQLEVGTEDLSDEGLAQIERVRSVLDQLPPREADFVDLYYFKKLKQTDIAEIFGVSQPTVCYRLQRAASRIQFLLNLPDIKFEETERVVSEILTDPIDVQIMVLMQKTTCQSEVAKILGVSQGFVRHRFIRSINKLRGLPGKEPFVRMFDLISQNLNILREVQRPMWGEKVMNIIL